MRWLVSNSLDLPLRDSTGGFATLICVPEVSSPVQCHPWRPHDQPGYASHFCIWSTSLNGTGPVRLRELSSDARRPRCRVNSAVNEATFPLHELTNVLQSTAGIARIPNLGQLSEPPRSWAKAVPSTP